MKLTPQLIWQSGLDHWMLEQLTFDKLQYLLMTYCRSVAGVAAAKEINVSLQNFDLDKTRELDVTN